MTDAESTEHFVRQLTENQNRLFGYVFSLIGDYSRAGDVVQETNLVLWRKMDEFQPDRPFLPWAFTIARFQVMASLRDRKRDRLLLDAELVQQLSAEAEQQAGEIEELRAALRPCLQLLTDGNRELIEQRYFRAMSVTEVATGVNRTTGAVKVALLRIRRQLASCVEQRLASGG